MAARRAAAPTAGRRARSAAADPRRKSRSDAKGRRGSGAPFFSADRPYNRACPGERSRSASSAPRPRSSSWLVLAVRGVSWGMLESSPLSLWHLWTETDEHANVEWSARLAAGNWADIPAYRAYFYWQVDFGPPEAWERWYQKNAYYSGPLYPYGLALLRRLFVAPFLPARFLHLLLAALAAACLARAVQVVAERLRQEATGAGKKKVAAGRRSIPGPVLGGAGRGSRLRPLRPARLPRLLSLSRWTRRARLDDPPRVALDRAGTVR